jgi:hypothetical protein
MLVLGIAVAIIIRRGPRFLLTSDPAQKTMQGTCHRRETVPWQGTTFLATRQQLDSRTIKLTGPLTANGQIT